jgi:hypothetical protein
LEAHPSHCHLIGGNLRFLHLALKQIRALRSLARRVGIVKYVFLGVHLVHSAIDSSDKAAIRDHAIHGFYLVVTSFWSD